MARGGLYKSDVQKARATLLVPGKHPSIDALRVALGNTGSKTTIHRYLQELVAEEVAGVGAKFAVSAALQDREEKLRVGIECVNTCNSRWWAYNQKQYIYLRTC